jgi:hypothetical protein
MQEAIQHQAMEDLHRLFQLLTIRYTNDHSSPPLPPLSLHLTLLVKKNYLYNYQSSCIG